VPLHAGLSACKWVDEMPGTFVSISDRHGVIRVWNVSNSQPIHIIKVRRCRLTPGWPQVDPRLTRDGPRLVSALEATI